MIHLNSNKQGKQIWTYHFQFPAPRCWPSFIKHFIFSTFQARIFLSLPIISFLYPSMLFVASDLYPNPQSFTMIELQITCVSRGTGCIYLGSPHPANKKHIHKIIKFCVCVFFFKYVTVPFNGRISYEYKQILLPHSIIKWQTLAAGTLRITKLKMLLNKQIAYEGYTVLFIVEPSKRMFVVYLQCYSGSIKVEKKMPYLTKRIMQSPGSVCFLVLLRRDKAEHKSKGNIKIKSKRKI